MKARAILASVMALVVGGMIVGAVIAAEPKSLKSDSLSSSKTVAVDDSAKTDVSLKDVKCPVSGKDVTKDASVDFEECKVYFCCDKCPKKWAEDKAHSKYGSKAHHQMVQTGQLKQTACPFTGKPVNTAMSLDIEGVKVEFCCVNCKGKVEKAKEEVRVGMVFKDTKKGFKLAKDVEKDAKK
jgi:hypothetical protein